MSYRCTALVITHQSIRFRIHQAIQSSRRLRTVHLAVCLQTPCIFVRIDKQQQKTFFICVLFAQHFIRLLDRTATATENCKTLNSYNELSRSGKGPFHSSFIICAINGKRSEPKNISGFPFLCTIMVGAPNA